MEPHWLRPDAAKNSGALNRQDRTAVLSWWFWPVKSVGGGLRSAASSCVSWPQLRPGTSQRCCAPELDKPGFTGGAPCLPALRLARSPCLFWNAGVALGRMAPHPPQLTWCGRPVLSFPRREVAFFLVCWTWTEVTPFQSSFSRKKKKRPLPTSCHQQDGSR